jgi:pilus assembly protein CpaB
MKMKSIVLLAMAIGCGLVAMLGVQQVLSGDRKPPVETGKVLVSLTNIMPGQPLDDTNVAFKDWPKDKVPEGAVIKPEQYTERSLRVSAVPNEPIMLAKLNEKGVFGGSSEIPKGMRVATVPVNMTQTHSGLILPGDRVDVVVTYSLNVANYGQIKKTKTILQYLEVFSTDNIRQSAVPNGENKEVNAKNISLLVTPDQYNLLMLAESKGTLSLALRRRDDSAEVHPMAVDDPTFEGARPGRGQNNKKDGSGDEGSVAEEGSDGVRTALDKESKKNADAKDTKVAEKDQTARPTWKLRIYEGDKVRDEEVELPEEPAANGQLPAKSGGRWQEFLKNMFQPASGRAA